MAAFTLAPLKYGKVVGRFVAEIGDGLDTDPYPDATPVSGTVTFTPSVSKVLVATGQPDPATVELLPITGTIDSNGYLTFNGAAGVWLVATNDPATNPTGFVYTVQYNLTYSGSIVDKSKFNISVPAADASTPSTFTDLAVVGPVVGSDATAIAKGDKGDTGATPTFTVGSVTTGATPAVTLTGNSPAYTMNFTLPGGGGVGTVKSVNSATPDLNGNVALTAQAVGLGNVDNTADVNKPVSTAQANALAGKLPMLVGATGRFCGVITDQSQLPSSGMQYGDMYVLLSAS